MTSVMDETTKQNYPGEHFLSAVRKNLDAAKGRVLRGRQFHWGERSSDGYDEGYAVESYSLSGFERTWKGDLKKVGIATAAVALHGRPLTPDDIVSEITVIIDLDREVPQLVGLCSIDGFTDAALVASYENRGLGEDISIVLVSPNQNGWTVHGVKNTDDDRVCKLFDPEGDNDRKRRLLNGLAERRVELKEGIPIDDLARDLGLEAQFVAAALKQEAKSDQSIRLFEVSGCTFVFRTSGQRIRHMGILSSIFRSKQKQQSREDLELERAALSKRREMVYTDIEKLEEKEVEKVTEGKEAAASKSTAVRRLAAEVRELRKDIERHNQTATLLSQKINIASTHIHNLTMNSLHGTGTVALPSDEELTETSVQTEEMLEDIQASSELADSLGSDQAEMAASTEETEIMKEFEDDSGGQESDAEFVEEDDDGFEPETIIPAFTLPEQPIRESADEQPNTGERSAEAS